MFESFLIHIANEVDLLDEDEDTDSLLFIVNFGRFPQPAKKAKYACNLDFSPKC